MAFKRTAEFLLILLTASAIAATAAGAEPAGGDRRQILLLSDQCIPAIVVPDELASRWSVVNETCASKPGANSQLRLLRNFPRTNVPRTVVYLQGLGHRTFYDYFVLTENAEFEPVPSLVLEKFWKTFLETLKNQEDVDRRYERIFLDVFKQMRDHCRERGWEFRVLTPDLKQTVRFAFTELAAKRPWTAVGYTMLIPNLSVDLRGLEALGKAEDVSVIKYVVPPESARVLAGGRELKEGHGWHFDFVLPLLLFNEQTDRREVRDAN